MAAASSPAPRAASAAPVDLLTDPDSLYRPWPLFVFNEEHEGRMGEERVTEILGKLRETGFGGVYIHPRPAMITEYLSDRWFELVRHTVRECRRLGMVPALYDENSYPSGFGGGLVPGRAPDTRSRFLRAVRGSGRAGLPGDALAVFPISGETPGGRIPAEAVEADTAWVAFRLEDLPGEPFLGEGPYVSLVDPLTTRTFLEETHERYRAALDDEDWQALGAIFTDEPHLPGSTLGPWSDGLHCSLRVLAAFQRRYGYDLRERLADLFFDTPACAATRHDYYDLLHHLWMEAWAAPLGAWCRENGIRLTGHYLEHDWPAPYATPGQAHLLSRTDWPGTDFLECFELLGEGFYDPQGFESAEVGREPHALYYLRQVRSVANQYGKERVMDESWGAGGHDATPVDWLRLGRYLAVHGVDHFVPHHSLQTLAGPRKQDHPQFFSDQIPVFPHLRPMNDELARLSLLGARSCERNRILLLDALTSGYCAARKADALEAGEGAFEEGDRLARTLRSFLPLRRSASGLAQNLSEALLDFDIGDEYVLEEIGAAEEGGVLRVGACAYECLLWPEGMNNLRSATADLLEEYLRAGGRLLGVRPSSFLIDGRAADARLAGWEERFGEGLRFFEGARALVAAAAEAVPPRLRLGGTPAAGLAHSYREGEDFGPVFLLHNGHPEKDFSGVPEFRDGEGSGAVAYSAASHRILDWAPGRPLVLPANEAVVLFPDPPTGLLAGVPRERPLSGEALAGCRFAAAERRAPNVLAIDRCELEVSGVRHGPESVCLANQRYWRAQGFSGNGWFMRVQTRGNLVRRDPFFEEGSGGIVRYRFSIDPSAPLEGLRLAVERPEQWEVTLNGAPVDFAGGAPWRDPRIEAAEVGGLLRHGENAVELRAGRFAVRQEIDAIYLLGEFSVEAAESGFAIAGPARPVDFGSWKDQGMPFYDEAVDYRFSLSEGTAPGIFRIGRGDWSGACVELLHGRRRETAYGPDIAWRIDPADGESFTIRVTGLAKNLFGPWHVKDRPRKRAWASFWRCDGLTIDGPRPGADYDLLDLGLLVSPGGRIAGQ